MPEQEFAAPFSPSDSPEPAAPATAAAHEHASAATGASYTELDPPNIQNPAEESPMLDVHPPHHAIESWKQYLLHMSTIVLGLLIAIGLEQSVEALHRAHERNDLREALRRDNEKAIVDAQNGEEVEIPSLAWLTSRADLVQHAIATGKPPIGNLPRAPHVSSDLPIDPAWNAAKASGLLPLLSREEVQVFSQMDFLFTHCQRAYDSGVAASRRRAEFEAKHLSPADSRSIDLTAVSAADLSHYSDVLGEEISAWDEYRVINSYLRGAETAVLKGELDLGSIQKAQRQFYIPLPVAVAQYREKNPAQPR